ncbi:MAG: thioredoxin [Candidatus Margulisbacteria bacterium GWF2_35_9]|nr:MAG: thioredoxin [Candidatus Margulisbacteria bacterium GWF2_35_9]
MVQEVTDQTFQKEVLGSDKPVLVDFWAPWCGPCRMVSPVVEEMEGKFSGKLKVVKINTDDNQNTSMKYQITGIPCMIIFKGGKEVNRLVGYRPADAMEKELNKLLP